MFFGSQREFAAGAQPVPQGEQERKADPFRRDADGAGGVFERIDAHAGNDAGLPFLRQAVPFFKGEEGGYHADRAVRRDPDNHQYREGALDAALAMKKNRSLADRLRDALGRK